MARRAHHRTDRTGAAASAGSGPAVRLAVSVVTVAVIGAVFAGCSSPVDIPVGATAEHQPTSTSAASTIPQEPDSDVASTSAPAGESADAPAPVPLPTRAIGVEPASITVPSLGIAQPLIPLGLENDGSMEVPDDFFDIGWYTGGGRPGGTGPVVIAGHVDSVDGAAVFYRLSELAAGDRLDVTGVDGGVATYEVYRVEDVSKAGFPTALVFGATMKDEVRLVTCSGPFDSELRDYTMNLVVFASRVV